MNLDDDWCFFPKLFQLVKLTLAGREDVHDSADVIHQNPAGFSNPFPTARFGITGLEGVFFNAVGNRFQLPLAGSGADDEVVDMR